MYVDRVPVRNAQLKGVGCGEEPVCAYKVTIRGGRRIGLKRYRKYIPEGQGGASACGAGR